MDTFGAGDKAHTVPLDVEISGKTYQLSRVRVADFAAATAHLRSTHIRAIMDDAGRVPGPLSAQALPEAWAAGASAGGDRGVDRDRSDLADIAVCEQRLDCACERGGRRPGPYAQNIPGCSALN